MNGVGNIIKSNDDPNKIAAELCEGGLLSSQELLRILSSNPDKVAELLNAMSKEEIKSASPENTWININTPISRILQGVLEKVPYWVLLIDKDYTIKYVNPPMYSISWDESHKLIWKNVQKDIELYLEIGLLDAIQSSCTNWEINYLYNIDYISKFWWKRTWRNFTVIPYDWMAMVMVEDITEKKKLKELLHQSNINTEFANSLWELSHLFSQVLTAINSYTHFWELQLEEISEIIQNLKDTWEFNSEIGKIESSTNSFKEIIEKIYAVCIKGEKMTRRFSEVRNIQKIKLKPLKVNEIFHNLGLWDWSTHNEVTFNINIQDPNVFVLGDRNHLVKAIANLIENSKEAIRWKGTITLDVSTIVADRNMTNTLKLTKEGEYLCISIKDTWSWIKEDDFKKIFKPFFWTSWDLNTGRWLGLFITQSIILKHGWNISVHSVWDKGTTFNLYLPVMDEGKIEIFTDEE
ncbi:MAG: GAF/PAS protein [uncultured bacterium (gcode 4)]|uniref:histidine kinase n=1 Tax=uncultured bacterium (gcode 4) TaxID=1234023 RepID=K2GVC8_9BACT|nr:MAG: GAF/PAS protein [uncultured bacterium (gcode 4)]